MSVEPAPDKAVIVRSVTKTFRVPREAVLTLKERAMHPLRRVRADEFVALNDVSFGVDEGEFFGIVGRNGSGKSTLLKCLAGIYRIDTGEMHAHGRISTFIELGVGFNQDLAARDNIVLNAIMLGLSPSQARALIDPVLDFAELHEFAELKLKNYSSGMHVRLAFSVMLQAKADIMLIDEVLAVGDASFQEKCFAEFTRMRAEGRTVLFVTHDMGAVQRFCDRAMLLERGRLVEMGSPEQVARRYVDMNFRRDAGGAEGPNPPEGINQTPGAAPVERADPVRFVFGQAEWPNGVAQDTVVGGDTCRLRTRLQALAPLHAPRVSFHVYNQHDERVLVLPCPFPEHANPDLEPGDCVDYKARFPCILGAGPYVVRADVTQGETGLDVIHRNDSLARFLVVNTYSTGGIVDIDYEAESEYIDNWPLDFGLGSESKSEDTGEKVEAG